MSTPKMIRIALTSSDSVCRHFAERAQKLYLTGSPALARSSAKSILRDMQERGEQQAFAHTSMVRVPA